MKQSKEQLPIRGYMLSLPVSVARRNIKLLCLLGISLLMLLALSDRISGGGNLPQLVSWRMKHEEPVLVDNSTIIAPPLTSLGYEADLVYEAMGSTDKDDYRLELETFLHRSFPLHEVNETDSESLLSILHEYLPAPPAAPVQPHPQTAFRRLLLFPPVFVFSSIKQVVWPDPGPVIIPRLARNIPETIYQTSWFPGTEPPADKTPPRTWRSLNPDYKYLYYDNAAAQGFMMSRFNQSDPDPKRQEPGYSLADTYLKMKDVPVMQSDFWRYAILASEGGVYSALSGLSDMRGR